MRGAVEDWATLEYIANIHKVLDAENAAGAFLSLGSARLFAVIAVLD